VEGNITALAANPGSWNPNSGGDINYVSSANPIPNKVVFRADWYIGKILVKNTKGVPESFTVLAQGGVVALHAA
jgi:hypothetical protein